MDGSWNAEEVHRPSSGASPRPAVTPRYVPPVADRRRMSHTGVFASEAWVPIGTLL